MTEPPAGYRPPPSYGEQVSAPSYPPHQATRADLQPYAAPLPYPQQSYPMAGQLVSPGGRLGAALLDALLMLVTLYIGWLVWSVVTWSEGQTPGKKLLGHVTADANTGHPLDWGQMAMREVCVKGLVGWLLGMLTCGVYGLVDSFMVFGDRQRTLHDKMSNSVVRHV
ncbi:RDD family protein [Asanoa ishikariensis]|uniref:RDD family protein n=1 Tax=Asanoa ishikariensis TaxID=137265 RepID=A0A1H3UQ68_9ACTN|nr:RDD family protein [Asanoa ishikariensis]SDZ64610.1 RDD family protein [Asanoa ishikariensis]